MKTARKVSKTLLIGIAALVLLLGAPLAFHAVTSRSAQEADTAAHEAGTAAQETGTADDPIRAQVDQELMDRRKERIEEAQSAIDETTTALMALDAGKKKRALDALARATGKLELILARDPGLALAPVDVDVLTRDVYATSDAIREARDQAEELLADGRVQEARTLLSGLASEVVIRVRSLPLATYPDAIKAVSPRIDRGEIEPARAALRDALATLVVTDRVIPLPTLRARHMLDQAEALAAKETRTAEEEKRLGELAKAAREQAEMAELLGYGEEQEREELRDQIAALERRVEPERMSESAFAVLRRSLRDLPGTFLD